MSEVPLQGSKLRDEGIQEYQLFLQTLLGGPSRYRVTSLIRNCAPLRPYSRTMPRAIWWP